MAIPGDPQGAVILSLLLQGSNLDYWFKPASAQLLVNSCNGPFRMFFPFAKLKKIAIHHTLGDDQNSIDSVYQEEKKERCTTSKRWICLAALLYEVNRYNLYDYIQ